MLNFIISYVGLCIGLKVDDHEWLDGLYIGLKIDDQKLLIVNF